MAKSSRTWTCNSAYNDVLKITDLLCNHSVMIDTTDRQGLTALKAACYGPSELVVERLLKFGARFPIQRGAPSASGNVLAQFATEDPTGLSGIPDSALHLAAFLEQVRDYQV